MFGRPASPLLSFDHEKRRGANIIMGAKARMPALPRQQLLRRTPSTEAASARAKAIRRLALDEANRRLAPFRFVVIVRRSRRPKLTEPPN